MVQPLYFVNEAEVQLVPMDFVHLPKANELRLVCPNEGVGLQLTPFAPGALLAKPRGFAF
jgi:hypothetical protein